SSTPATSTPGSRSAGQASARRRSRSRRSGWWSSPSWASTSASPATASTATEPGDGRRRLPLLHLAQADAREPARALPRDGGGDVRQPGTVEPRRDRTGARGPAGDALVVPGLRAPRPVPLLVVHAAPALAGAEPDRLLDRAAAAPLVPRPRSRAAAR